MRSIALLLGLVALPSFLSAQGCYDSNLGTSLGAGQDIVYPIQPIGFAFPLGGATYTDVHISDHGFVQLSNGGVPAPATGATLWTPTTANFTAGSPKICALWSDIIADLGTVHINSSPTQCVITWQNVHTFGAPTALFDMQIKMEPSGVVSFFYGPGVTNNSTFGSPSEQGIVGITPGGGATLPAASDFSLSGATSDDTTYELFVAANSFDMPATSMFMAAVNPGYAFVFDTCVQATSTDFGTGCVDLPTASVYEEWLTGTTFDLDNTALTWLRSANGYQLITSLPGAIVPPSIAAVNVAATFLDGQQTFTLSSPMPSPGGPVSTITITTKGQIELGGTPVAVIDFTPTTGEFLARTNAAFSCWHDYAQTAAGSGLILYEEVGGIAYATWNGVYSYLTTNSNTFQFQLNLATGDVALVFGTVTGTASYPMIVGYSPAGASQDPGASDYATLGALTMTQPLRQTGVGLPTLGNPSYGIQIDNVPPLLPAAFLFFGDTAIPAPGVDLTFLGMPGCAVYSNLNLSSFTVPTPGGSGIAPLPIPNNQALLGTTLVAQAIALSLDTPANLVASNGTTFTIGN